MENNEPIIEEFEADIDEIIEEYKKNHPPSKRYKCRNCYYIFPKSYKLTGICINCHTKNMLELVDIHEIDLQEIDSNPLPTKNYQEDNYI